MNEVIISIRKASIELSKWFGYATATIDRIEVEEDRVPQTLDLSEFGRWYKKDQWHLSGFNEYSQIDQHHIKLHELYDEMMAVVNKVQKQSFFKKLTKAQVVLSKADQKTIINKYQEFRMEFNTILLLLKTIQKNIEQSDLSSLGQNAA